MKKRAGSSRRRPKIKNPKRDVLRRENSELCKENRKLKKEVKDLEEERAILLRAREMARQSDQVRIEELTLMVGHLNDEILRRDSQLKRFAEKIINRE